MDKHVKMAAGARSRFVQQARARCAEALDGGGEVRDFQGDVVQAGTVLFEKSRDGGIGRGGLQQFDAGFASGEHGNVDALGGDGFTMGDGEAEGFVEGKGGVEIGYGDAKVINPSICVPLPHGRGSVWGLSDEAEEFRNTDGFCGDRADDRLVLFADLALHTLGAGLELC